MLMIAIQFISLINVNTNVFFFLLLLFRPFFVRIYEKRFIRFLVQKRKKEKSSRVQNNVYETLMVQHIMVCTRHYTNYRV